jgi:hypothetical protein
MGNNNKAPDPPNLADAAQQGVYADLETYPSRYLIDAAAQMGTKVNINGQTVDFTGQGTADNAAVMSDKMAAALLAIQQNQGPAFVQQRIDELKQADPQGYAARQDLFKQIMDQVNANPDRPLAQDLQDQISSTLASAGKLDARGLEQVQGQARGDQIAHGIYLGNAPASTEASAVVGASNNLRDQQQQQALAYLNSGTSPEDVAYRRLQQSLGNLSSFSNGTTPSAQFGELSSAGAGAVPFMGGPGVNTATDPNAAMTGLQNALGIYSGQSNWQNSQANPWLAGISTGLSAVGPVSQAYQNTWGGQGGGGTTPVSQTIYG